MRGFIVLAVVASLSTPVHAEAPIIDDGYHPIEPGPVYLTAAQRRARAELIRDTAASAGMTNAALLAGIGEVETNFAHCWSEATWACQGPSSSSCGGGPVIAGGSDGPCSLQQGGLGMFQFDSGTFSQTVATYGSSIVTMQGNVNAVIPFLVTRAIQSVSGVNTEAEALAWMNSITIQNGDAQYEDWLYFVAWRYNGCMGCTTQINKYRNGTNKLRDEFGPAFWTIATDPVVPVVCEPVPADGRTIDDTDSCFTKGGTASSWYAASGVTGSYLYTYTTDDPAPDNHATWELTFAADGRYRVEVNTAGGESHQAKYVVTHAAGTTDVVIDQAAAADFQSLGEFDFVAGEPFAISLGDNTGEPYVSSAKIVLAFDAVRIVLAGEPRAGDNDPADPDLDAPGTGGGCTTGGPGGTVLLGLGIVGLIARRRRACPR
jgi:hypothetical protein